MTWRQQHSYLSRPNTDSHKVNLHLINKMKSCLEVCCWHRCIECWCFGIVTVVLGNGYESEPLYPAPLPSEKANTCRLMTAIKMSTHRTALLSFFDASLELRRSSSSFPSERVFSSCAFSKLELAVNWPKWSCSLLVYKSIHILLQYSLWFTTNYKLSSQYRL